MRSIVISPHPDDEVLGCGGTIAKHVAQGDIVHSVFMSDGVNSRLDSSKVKLNRRLKLMKSFPTQMEQIQVPSG